MAPKLLTKYKYSEKSNVWAFGVLLWELWAEGRLPYFAVKSDEELIERVCSRWERLPANRPTFQKLQGLLMQTLVALVAVGHWTLDGCRLPVGCSYTNTKHRPSWLLPLPLPPAF